MARLWQTLQGRLGVTLVELIPPFPDARLQKFELKSRQMEVELVRCQIELAKDVDWRLSLASVSGQKKKNFISASVFMRQEKMYIDVGTDAGLKGGEYVWYQGMFLGLVHPLGAVLSQVENLRSGDFRLEAQLSHGEPGILMRENGILKFMVLHRLSNVRLGDKIVDVAGNYLGEISQNITLSTDGYSVFLVKTGLEDLQIRAVLVQKI